MQTIQDIEKKLYDYARFQRRLKELREQANEILAQHNTLLDGLLKRTSMEDVRVQGGFTSDPVFAAVQKIIDEYGTRLDAIRNEITDIFYHIDEIEKMVSDAGLTETERQYIKLRYFDGLRVSQTAASMGYSENQTQRIKNRALQKMHGK